jgi:hypothetical protein
VQEEEMKKIKVLDYLVHSYSSRNVSQLIKPMPFVSFSCFANGKEVEKELTDVPD